MTGSPAASRQRVVVVGSVNADYVVRVVRRPGPGETIGGASFDLLPGGKGANQAVAAARLGAGVDLVACVGNDALGTTRLGQLASEGVATSAVERRDEAHTGAAFITVTPDGENTIVVAPGANELLGPNDLDRFAPLIAAAAVVVVQFEIPYETVAHAVELAAPAATVLVNCAPYHPMSPALLGRTGVLVANELEAAALCGSAAATVDEAYEAAARILAMGPGAAVITLGASGAVVAGGGLQLHVPAPKVAVVDTTGAGDALVGALAARLASAEPLADAVAVAVAVGSATTERLGALPVVPQALRG